MALRALSIRSLGPVIAAAADAERLANLLCLLNAAWNVQQVLLVDISKFHSIMSETSILIRVD